MSGARLTAPVGVLVEISTCNTTIAVFFSLSLHCLQYIGGRAARSRTLGCHCSCSLFFVGVSLETRPALSLSLSLSLSASLSLSELSAGASSLRLVFCRFLSALVSASAPPQSLSLFSLYPQSLLFLLSPQSL